MTTPDTGQIDARLRRLEDELATELRRAGRLRVTTAVLAAGVSALLVAMSLPWLREGAFPLDDNVFGPGWGTTASGWQILLWALSGPETNSQWAGVDILAMSLPLLAAIAGLVAVFTQRPGAGLAAAVINGIATVGLLIFLLGLNATLGGNTAVASGLAVAVAACAANTAAGTMQSAVRRISAD